MKIIAVGVAGRERGGRKVRVGTADRVTGDFRLQYCHSELLTSFFPPNTTVNSPYTLHYPALQSPAG